MKYLLCFLLAGCSLSPSQRTAAETRGANRAIATLHAQLDAAGGGIKAIVPTVK